MTLYTSEIILIPPLTEGNSKWSRDIFTVRKKVALQGNPMNHRYFLGGEPESYFRHELLWVPRNTDTTIVEGYIVHQEKLIAEDPLSEDEWTP